MRTRFRWTIATSLMIAACGDDDGDASGRGSGAAVTTGGATPGAVEASSTGTSGGGGVGGGDTGGGAGEASSGSSGGDASGGAGGRGAAATCSGVPDEDFDPLAGWVSPAEAPTFVVSSAEDSGPGTLREAIANAPEGAIIGFDVALTGARILLEATLILDRSVTIDGSAAPGITLDGGDAVRILQGNTEADRRYALYGLRFERGRTSGSGGALSFNGEHLDVEVGGCWFEGNEGTEGGAIRVGYRLISTTFIHDSVFVDNRGEDDSNGFSGGAISATATNLHIARCRFEGNVGSPAGAVYTIHAQPLVEDSVFLDNSSQDGTGAFFMDGAGPGDSNDPTEVAGHARLLRSRFARNRGRGANGGAALLWGYPMDDITVEDSLFVDNIVEDGAQSAQGGALKVHIESTAGGTQRFRAARVAFVSNLSRRQGGALWLDGDGAVELENVLLSENVAEGDRGGGITFNQASSSPVTVDHATFVGNRGGQGCGAFWLQSPDANVAFRNTLVALNEGANAWEVQFGYPPRDEGGNIQWPAPSGGSAQLGQALLVDPRILALEETDGTLVRPLDDDSPARDAAAAPNPATDARGAPRDGAADIGAFEVGASCAR